MDARSHTATAPRLDPCAASSRRHPFRRTAGRPLSHTRERASSASGGLFLQSASLLYFVRAKIEGSDIVRGQVQETGNPTPREPADILTLELLLDRRRKKRTDPLGEQSWKMSVEMFENIGENVGKLVNVG